MLFEVPFGSDDEVNYKASASKFNGSPFSVPYPASASPEDLAIILGRSGGSGWQSRSMAPFGTVEFKFLTSADLASPVPFGTDGVVSIWSGVTSVGNIRGAAQNDNPGGQNQFFIPGFTKALAAQVIVAVSRSDSGPSADPNYPPPFTTRVNMRYYAIADLAAASYSGANITGDGSSSGVTYGAALELF